MQIRADEIEYKKQVGTLNRAPIMEVGLKGGLHLVFAVRGKGIETLGAAPHPAIAKHLARKKTDDKIEWTELAKSEFVDPAHFEWLLPECEALTAVWRKVQGLE